MPRPAPYTPEQLALLREMAPTCTDPVIAAALGFSPGKVLHIRQKLGIKGAYRSRRPPELIETVRLKYVLDGQSADAVGKLLGLTATSVRRIASQNGFKRDVEFSRLNAAEASRRNAASRPPREVVAKAPKPPPSRFVSGNDADLIADFLSRKAITVLAPGTAAGLSAIESQFYAARPIASGSKDLEEKQRRARGRGSFARRHELAQTAVRIAAE